MVQALDDVRGYTSGKTFDEFRSDRMTVQAVLYNLAVIGEASRFVPDELRSRHPEVDWLRMRGMRNVLVHEYFGADLSIVWQTVEVDLPSLADSLRRILSSEP